MDGQMDGWMDGYIDRQAQIDRPRWIGLDRQAQIQIDRQIDRPRLQAQMDRPRQIGLDRYRQIDRQIDIQTSHIISPLPLSQEIWGIWEYVICIIGSGGMDAHASHSCSLTTGSSVGLFVVLKDANLLRYSCWVLSDTQIVKLSTPRIKFPLKLLVFASFGIQLLVSLRGK